MHYLGWRHEFCRAKVGLKASITSNRNPVILALGMLTSLFILWQTAFWTKQLVTEEIRTRSSHTLDLVAANLSAQLSRFRSQPEMISANPLLPALLQGSRNPEQIQRVNLELERINRISGALDTYLMDNSGVTIATSNWNKQRTFLNRRFEFRPYFKVAMKGRRGSYFALGTTSRERGYFYSFPVKGHSSNPQILGVIVVKISLEHLEKKWVAQDHEVIVVDNDGVVFLSNRSDWHYKLLEPLPKQRLQALMKSRRYDGEMITLIPVRDRQYSQQRQLQGIAIDPVGSTKNQSTKRYLVEQKRLPEEDWRIMLLAKDDEIAKRVNIALILAALLLASLVLTIANVLQRRRRLAERLALKDVASRELEQRVEERTIDLSKANDQLRTEIREREHAETELHAAQAGLVQATKLAALGHMSAGVSHELNQPLAAIRSYAVNAQAYLERGVLGTANENLDSIAELADRMGQIIKNLRTYARNESISSRPVVVAKVLRSALGILENRINTEAIQLDLKGFDDLFEVLAGDIRLQQVFVNIVSNALDAMKSSQQKLLMITIFERSGKIHTEIADTGTGIPEALISHVFDPFYSTKPVGEGMGLGLSLTYGIVDQFGGSIIIKNRPEVGAVFTVILSKEST